MRELAETDGDDFDRRMGANSVGRRGDLGRKMLRDKQ